MSATSTSVPTITLNDGSRIPQLGFGVFQIDPAETAEAVAKALEAGYRHIDTAEMYENERGVGEAIRESGISREDVWITSKLDNGSHEPDDARRAIERTLTELGVDQVDLFLIHWPLPTRYGGDFVSTWKAMESFASEGLAKSVGVSNFEPAHLERLAAECELTPSVNQIELHPYFQNGETDAYGTSHEIVTEAWSPIGQGTGVLDDGAITGLAERLDRTPAQVVLRWHVQHGRIVFPKSKTPERIEENLRIFDFELDPEQMAAIDALDQGEEGRIGPHPDEFAMVPGDD